ncbi:MAG: hypothetical protein ACT4QC_06650 [Planctomycetaceae bacterium]
MAKHIFQLGPDDGPTADSFGEDIDHICWSCRAELDLRTAVFLDGGDGPTSVHVCQACWEQVPVAERIRLQWLIRRASARGSD